MSLMVQNQIYSIGGYDAKKNTFLASCERYDIEKDKWTMIADLKLAKCAFAGCAVADRYIYTLGGYDGNQRLDLIEQYDVEGGEWNLINIQLPNPLSNLACFCLDENNIILLGGGHSEGFSLDVR